MFYFYEIYKFCTFLDVFGMVEGIFMIFLADFMNNLKINLGKIDKNRKKNSKKRQKFPLSKMLKMTLF